MLEWKSERAEETSEQVAKRERRGCWRVCEESATKADSVRGHVPVKNRDNERCEFSHVRPMLLLDLPVLELCAWPFRPFDGIHDGGHDPSVLLHLHTLHTRVFDGLT